MDVFDEWQAKKDLLGFAEKTHSEFAEYLLRICSEQREGLQSQASQQTPTG